jgi:hypothetical protein
MLEHKSDSARWV